MFAKDNRAVRVIGDSFSEYYMPYLQARFTNTWREHIDTFTIRTLTSSRGAIF